MQLTIMGVIKIAGFLLALSMAFFTWKASYDTFQASQAKMLAELYGIHEQLIGMNQRIVRIEEKVFPVAGSR